MDDNTGMGYKNRMVRIIKPSSLFGGVEASGLGKCGGGKCDEEKRDVMAQSDGHYGRGKCDGGNVTVWRTVTEKVAGIMTGAT